MSDMGRDLHLARSSSTFFFKSGMWFNLIKSASLEKTLIPKYLIFPDAVEWKNWKEQLIGRTVDFNQLLNNLRLLRKSLLM